MKPAHVLLVGFAASSIALADGVTTRRWSRLPKIDKCSPHYAGDPVLISGPWPTSVSQTEDARISLPRSDFRFTRTFVADQFALGQVTPTALPPECRESVLPSGEWAFARPNWVHSLMSRVDTRCSTYTRVFTTEVETRFFGPVPSVSPGSSAWVPRIAEALSEPSRPIS